MMGLAGPPSEVLFDVNSSHQSGMDSCFSRMAVRRIHCNEWSGWAEQVSRRVWFLFPCFSHTVSFLFLLFSSPPMLLLSKGLVTRKSKGVKGIRKFIAQRDHVSFTFLWERGFREWLFCFESTAMAFNV